MLSLIRSASLTHLPQLAAACGLDVRRLLTEAGLPHNCLTDPDLKVPVAGVARLLEIAASGAHEPAFGLRLAEGRRLSNLGPLGLLLRDVETLDEALTVIVRYVRIHNEAMSLSLERHSGLVVLRVDVVGAGSEPIRQFTELVVAVTFRFLQTFLGSGWSPKLVCFGHRKPDKLSEHRRFFGCPLSFDDEYSGIVCDKRALSASNNAADPVMARYMGQVMGPLGPETTRWEDRVRRCIVLLLPRGHARSDIVANHLGLSVRTLTRRLKEEEWRFNELVDAVRDELVSRYLADRSKPLTDIAPLLGFASPSTFSRWFRQRYGASARETTRQR